MSNQDLEIQEWLLLPNSDVSEDEVEDDEVEELNFDRVFQQQITRQLQRADMILEEVSGKLIALNLIFTHKPTTRAANV